MSEGRRRGLVGVYAAAFGLLVVAAGLLAAASLGSLESIGLLWASAWISLAAIVAAVVSLVVPRRR